MAFHVQAAYAKTIEIYATVLGEPDRMLRFASILVYPYLVLSFFLPPGTQFGGDGTAMPLLLLLLVHSLLFLYVSVTLAVRWHRWIILGEDHATRSSLPLGRRELQYFGKSLLLMIICVVAAFVAFGLLSPIVAAAGGASGVLTALFMTASLIAAFLIATLIIARFGLILPATALDREQRFMDSWNLTRAHWQPFWMLLVLVSIPQAVAITVIDWTVIGASWFLIDALASLAREVVFLVGVATYAIALSSNYLAVAPARHRGNGQDLETA